jgi:hypothetical protein
LSLPVAVLLAASAICSAAVLLALLVLLLLSRCGSGAARASAPPPAAPTLAARALACASLARENLIGTPSGPMRRRPEEAIHSSAGLGLGGGALVTAADADRACRLAPSFCLAGEAMAEMDEKAEGAARAQ